MPKSNISDNKTEKGKVWIEVERGVHFANATVVGTESIKTQIRRNEWRDKLLAFKRARLSGPHRKP